MSLETRELMEEIFPLTDQVNLLSETSRYALDNLLASHLMTYNGTKSNAKSKSNSNTNINTCYNNETCSPSKRLQHESLRRQSSKSKGMSRSGI
jgi:hypothetical protein